MSDLRKWAFLHKVMAYSKSWFFTFLQIGRFKALYHQIIKILKIFQIAQKCPQSASRTSKVAKNLFWVLLGLNKKFHFLSLKRQKIKIQYTEKSSKMVRIFSFQNCPILWFLDYFGSKVQKNVNRGSQIMFEDFWTDTGNFEFFHRLKVI